MSNNKPFKENEVLGPPILKCPKCKNTDLEQMLWYEDKVHFRKIFSTQAEPYDATQPHPLLYYSTHSRALKNPKRKRKNFRIWCKRCHTEFRIPHLIKSIAWSG